MSVCVGGFHEPGTVGGLAHFCEHMLFMGSEKYPDENEFTAFVSKHSGSDNASTDNHVTVYAFDISPSKFEQGKGRICYSQIREFSDVPYLPFSRSHVK